LFQEDLAAGTDDEERDIATRDVRTKIDDVFSVLVTGLVIVVVLPATTVLPRSRQPLSPLH
jgi:hypothetical protein